MTTARGALSWSKVMVESHLLLLLAILISILPGFAWLVFFLQEDPKPEPKRLIALVFLWGGLATFFAIVFEKLYASLFASIFRGQETAALGTLVGTTGGKTILLLLGLAIIEEGLKFGAAYLSIHRSKYFDEAIDAMIYMVIAGLGFATAENILFALGILQEGLSAGSIHATVVGGIFQTTTLRFVGATLLHSLGSGLVGYYWALGIVQNRQLHFIARGLVYATVLHAAFNYFIIKFSQIQILYPSILLVMAAIFVLYDFEKIRGYPRTKI